MKKNKQSVNWEVEIMSSSIYWSVLSETPMESLCNHVEERADSDVVDMHIEDAAEPVCENLV